MATVMEMKDKAESRCKELLGYLNLGKRVKPLLIPVRGDHYGHINVRMATDADEKNLVITMKELAKGADGIILIVDAFFHESEKTPCVTGIIHTPEETYLRRFPYIEVNGLYVTHVDLDWEELDFSDPEAVPTGFFANPFK